MTFAQYLRVLRQHWLVIVLLTALGFVLAAVITARQAPSYSATTQLFVSVSTGSSSVTQLNQGSDFTQQRVKSYADIVTSPSVLESAISKVGLADTPAQLAKRVSVDSPLETVLLNVTVRDTQAQRAADVSNAIAAAFPPFVANLERSTSKDTASPVTISVTKPASAPAVPDSPRVPLNLALGLLVGLAFGVGAALLRHQTNTSIRTVADIENITGAIPLGVVPYDPATGKTPLVDVDQPTSRSEAYRTLRTNLQFADVDKPPRVIVVTSALPSEGKSTSAANLALTLAAGGARVVLVDGDLRKPAVARYLGMSSGAGLTSVLAGQHDLRDVLVAHGRHGLVVLPAGPKPPNPSELLGSGQMTDLLINLANHFDMVIIDAPPVLPVTDAAVLASVADGALLVVRHGRTRREEALRAVQSLGAVKAKLLGSVLNFAPTKKRRGGYDGYGFGYGYGDDTPAYELPASPGPDPSARRHRGEQGAAEPALPAAGLPTSMPPTSMPPTSMPPTSAPWSPEPEAPVEPPVHAPVHAVNGHEQVAGFNGYAGPVASAHDGPPRPTAQAEPVDTAFPEPADDDFPVPPRATGQRATRSRAAKNQPPRRLRRPT